MSEIHPRTRRLLLTTCGRVCTYCGAPIEPRRAGPGHGFLPADAATLDHTLGRGSLVVAGLPRWALTAPSCWGCNVRAGAPLELADLAAEADVTRRQAVTLVQCLWDGRGGDGLLQSYLRLLGRRRGLAPARVCTRGCVCTRGSR